MLKKAKWIACASFTIGLILATFPLANYAKDGVRANQSITSQSTRIQQQQQQIKKLQKQMHSLMSQRKGESHKAGTSSTNKNAPVTTGVFGGPFKVPGLGLNVKLGGFAELNTYYDTNKSTGPGPALGLETAGIPVNNENQHSEVNFSAKESRIIIDGHKKTDYGPLRLFFESDFAGSGGNAITTNGYGFRLRQAYGELGHLLLGQTWSTFVDLRTGPSLYLTYRDTLALTIIRQPMIRWTQKAGKNITFEFALENPKTQAFLSKGGPPLEEHGHTPDGVARMSIDESWGHFSFIYLARQLQVNDAKANVNDEAFGYGAKVTGKVNIASPKNFFKFEVMGGHGIGRYITDLAVSVGSATVNPNTNKLDPITAYSVSTQLGHQWTKSLRSTVLYGYVKVKSKSYRPGSTLGHTNFAGANLLWRIVPHVTLGLQYLYGQRVNRDGNSGFDNRFQTISRFYF